MVNVFLALSVLASLAASAAADVIPRQYKGGPYYGDGQKSFDLKLHSYTHDE
jgi:hypothetical protein